MLLSLSDKNDDSVLDKSEWLAAELAQEHKAVQLFIFINDENKDGKLTKNEMENMDIQLPGSGVGTRKIVQNLQDGFLWCIIRKFLG